jgi:tetratricopeptide (TPR) repeat protein
MEDTKMRIKYLSIMVLSILLAVGAFACGGGSDPVNNSHNPTNDGGPSLTGRILDREGDPVGQPFVTMKLTGSSGQAIAPVQQPAGDGPDAGRFKYIGLPTGILLKLEITLVQTSLGRNLGWRQNITLTSGSNFDLGDIVLENDFINLGWAAYSSKDYSLALTNFNRALVDRYAQANLSYSSSAYTGIGWVYAKRGKDYQDGLHYVDPDTGAYLDTINSFEWDQALHNFDIATTNQNDSDAWVGTGGTYLTLLGQSNKDPVILGPWIPFYAFLHYYFPEAQGALNKALQVDPTYKSPHDDITVNDIKATLIFLRWIQGQQVTPEEISTLSHATDINEGSRQLLEGMADLVLYNPFPQL